MGRVPRGEEERSQGAGKEPPAAPVLPNPALPKGGGAIAPIGEKLVPNPQMGTAGFTFPIFTSPGRGGFGPSLALTYDSASGNGPYGLGWSLSLANIARKTDKGLPRYDDSDI